MKRVVYILGVVTVFVSLASFGADEHSAGPLSAAVHTPPPPPSPDAPKHVTSPVHDDHTATPSHDTHEHTANEDHPGAVTEHMPPPPPPVHHPDVHDAPQHEEHHGDVVKHDEHTTPPPPPTVHHDEATHEPHGEEHHDMPPQHDEHGPSGAHPGPDHGVDHPKEDSIDNISIDVSSRGDWVFKRKMWEKTETTYEKIREALDEVFEARIPFFQKRNNTDRDLDEFREKTGFKAGELEETLEALIDALNEERVKDGMLTAKERKILGSLPSKKKELMQLHDDMTAINELDDNLDAAISKLRAEVNKARSYDEKAWEAFKQISREWSNDKIQLLNNGAETALKNINNSIQYIKHTLSGHFNETASSIKSEMTKIKSKLSALSIEGISLKAEVKKLLAEDTAETKKETEKKAIKKEKAAVEKAVEESTIGYKVKSFFGKVGGWFAGVFDHVKGFFAGLGRYLPWHHKDVKKDVSKESKPVKHDSDEKKPDVVDQPAPPMVHHEPTSDHEPVAHSAHPEGEVHHDLGHPIEEHHDVPKDVEHKSPTAPAEPSHPPVI